MTLSTILDEILIVFFSTDSKALIKRPISLSNVSFKTSFQIPKSFKRNFNTILNAEAY